MLEHIKDYVEKKVNRSVGIKELRNAIDSAAKNIIANYLIPGHNVTSEEFLEVLVNCIKVKKNFIDANVLALVDQGGQLKRITRAVILDYNRTTVFGITPENKKTWLGTYDTPEEAEKMRDHINRQISESEEIVHI